MVLRYHLYTVCLETGELQSEVNMQHLDGLSDHTISCLLDGSMFCEVVACANGVSIPVLIMQSVCTVEQYVEAHSMIKQFSTVDFSF